MTFDRDVTPHWAGLLPVLAGAAIGTFADSHNTRRLSVAALIFWAALAIASGGRDNDWSWAGGIVFAVGCAIALFGVGALMATLRNSRLVGLGNDIPWPALAAIIVALGLLQVAEHPTVREPTLLMLTVAGVAIGVACTALAAARRWLAWTDVAALAALGILALLFALNVPVDDLWSRVFGTALVVLAALWAISLGQSGTIPQAKTLGLVALGAEVIYLYVRTFGTLMDTALAFLMGGVLFIVLAWALYRLDRYLAARSRPAAAEMPS
jgi:uncharacterized membrane protein